MDPDSPTPVPAQSPWRTIWFSPRLTIRHIVDSEVRPSWLPVLALAALHQAIVEAALADGTLSIARSAMPVIVGVLQLIFGVLVGPFLLAFVGGWLGGEADPADIRQAVAWSQVPYAVATLFWIPILLTLSSRPLAETFAPLSPPELFALAMFLAIVVAVIWSYVLEVITLAEVQRFSILRALASTMIVFIPILLVGVMA